MKLTRKLLQQYVVKVAQLHSQIDDLKYTVDHQVRLRSDGEAKHKIEMEELRKKLHERELAMKESLARSCGQMIEAVARMVSPGTF